jgi:hypothetical protein
MGDEAFSYSLEKALHDTEVRHFIAESRREDGDIYEGLLELVTRV